LPFAYLAMSAVDPGGVKTQDYISYWDGATLKGENCAYNWCILPHLHLCEGKLAEILHR